MKITIAQLNPTVGNINENLSKLAYAYSEGANAGSDLVVFSELFVVGYPPRDLLDLPWFIDRSRAALEEICKISSQYSDTGILFGMPWPHGSPGRGLYNAAVLVYRGEIWGCQYKSLLPIYDVFDEARYFDPAPGVCLLDFKGQRLGISICEDAWNDPVFWPRGRIYDFDPIHALARQGADILINISASPFHAGKEETRFNLITNHALRHKLPFVYVNQIGANDELVFDGRSMIIGANGQPLLIAPAFEEFLTTIDLSKDNTKYVNFVPSERIASLKQALVLGIRDYMKKCGFRKAVLGLSGGIDSAICAVLAVEAVGPDNVLGITMPSPFSSTGSVDDSVHLAENLGMTLKNIPISSIYQTYLSSLGEHFSGKPADITEENIQARIRGNILMAFSNKYGHLVLSTGNKSELAMGYCTMYGDMSGGLSVLADVPKTMVYELAHYINREKVVIPEAIITKAPSAELKPDQKDQDTLPPYEMLDQILHYYVEENLSMSQLIGQGFDPDVVRWVIHNADRNEYKRRQAAPGLKVTTKAFGAGRRMPIAAKIQHE